MIDHYNAFISYKHAPEDNRVAEAIHKGLERFHIPGRIRKKTGIKRINRIFRDKDELPITSDLSDTIANALANSDYLIVICSTNTKQSAWVPREIEFFLRNHTKNEIFTVLVNGEPYDVIPEILLYDDRMIQGANGYYQNVRIPIEPLSCDYRMPLNKAKKTELPRLASGLLGCSYDELMNRHRQYRIKLLTTAFSTVLALTLGFSGYMYYSKDKIHKNYLESLKNQSKYLANESTNLLEKEQRITALQLALEALPKDDADDRPVTAEAVKALTDATLAYEGNNGTNINAAWNYQMPNIISDFQVSSDGKNIAILDDGSVVCAWNTSTHNRMVYIDDMGSQVKGITFLNEKILALWTDTKLVSYDVTSGERLWDYSPEDDRIEETKDLMTTETSVYINTSKSGYHEIDIATGELKNKVEIPTKEGYEDFSIIEGKISPDGKKIAFRGLGGWNGYAYGVLDIASKKLDISEISEETVKEIGWIGNDNLMVSTAIVDMSGSMATSSMEIVSSDYSTLKCLDPGDLSEKWTADYVCTGVDIEHGFVKLGEDKVGYYSGNVISVYDLKSGKLKYSNNVNDSVIDVSDVDGDGEPTYVTEDGGLASPAPSVDEDAVYYTKYFADKLRQVTVNSGVYVRQNMSHEVIYYGVHVYDEEWKPLGDNSSLNGNPDSYYLDRRALAILSNTDSGPALSLFGLDSDAGFSENPLEGENTYDYVLLGMHKDNVYLGYDNDGEFSLVTADLKGKDVKYDKLCKMSSTLDKTCALMDGKLAYQYKNENFETVLAVRDLDTGKTKEIVAPEDIGFADAAPTYYDAEKAVVLSGEKDYVFDVENDKSYELDAPEEWTGCICCSDVSSEGVFAISDGKTILMIDKKGKIKNRISCPSVTPVSMTFIENALVVIYNDGSLYWYSKDSDKFLKRVDVSISYNYNGTANFDYDSENHLLYVQMDMLTDVVDTQSGLEICHISNSFGHHNGRDIFLTISRESSEDLKVGYYKRYTVSELIDKAHRILQDAKLSDDMKVRYGIETDED